MPGCSIAAEKNNVIFVLFGQFAEKYICAIGIAIRQYKKKTIPGNWFNSPVSISVFPYMMARNSRSGPFLAPTILGLIDPAKSSLILKHQPDFFLIVENFLQFRDSDVNFFEEAMTSSLAFFGCLLRGMTFLQPLR